jgi:hypothetical protein
MQIENKAFYGMVSNSGSGSLVKNCCTFALTFQYMFSAPKLTLFVHLDAFNNPNLNRKLVARAGLVFSGIPN